MNNTIFLQGCKDGNLRLCIIREDVNMKNPRRLTGDMAHPRGFEPPTCRLGGGRSILLSYGCICPRIVPKKICPVNEKTAHFFDTSAYTGKISLEGSKCYGGKGRSAGYRRFHLCRSRIPA